MKDDLTTVSALYDSHVHWLMTGEKKSYFDLAKYKKLSEVSPKNFEKKNFRGHWLFGFGWDDSQLSSTRPCLELDKMSSEFPICFIKKDAHSCLLNSAALESVLSFVESIPGTAQFIQRDGNGLPTGILKESAFYSIYAKIPELSNEEIKTCLLEAQNYFLANGFTHIRDMTCSKAQWLALIQMQRQNELRLFADINFNVDSLQQAIHETIPFVLEQRKEKYKNLTIKGIKFFSDGSLGSSTAWISENYLGTQSQGNSLWYENDVYELTKLCWQNDLEVSVHTLGDQAVESIVEIARRLYSQKIRGYLNLEHVELVKPETIVKMKSLYVRCHMQPSHWLSDKKFLKEKLSPSALKNLFAWEALRRAKVPISFGSDSPIEEANLELTHQALKDSATAGIEEFKGDFFEHYRHPAPSAEGVLAQTVLEGFKVIKVT